MGLDLSWRRMMGLDLSWRRMMGLDLLWRRAAVNDVQCFRWQGATIDPEATFRFKRQGLNATLNTMNALELSHSNVTALHGAAEEPSQGTSESPFTRIEVKREELLDSSFRAFAMLTRRDMLKPLRIKYSNEAGIDSGGLVKDWFLELSRRIVDQNLGLFLRSDASDLYSIDPRASHIHDPDLMVKYFEFVGKFLAKAIVDRQVVDIRFDRTVHLHLLDRMVTLRDLEDMDPQTCKSLQWLLDQPTLVGVMDDLTFSHDMDMGFGAVETVDLIPQGQTIPVTDDNREAYVHSMVDFNSRVRIKDQVCAISSDAHRAVSVVLSSNVLLPGGGGDGHARSAIA